MATEAADAALLAAARAGDAQIFLVGSAENQRRILTWTQHKQSRHAFVTGRHKLGDAHLMNGEIMHARPTITTTHCSPGPFEFAEYVLHEIRRYRRHAASLWTENANNRVVLDGGGEKQNKLWPFNEFYGRQMVAHFIGGDVQNQKGHTQTTTML